MTSSVISFASFTHFSNLNTYGTNADMFFYSFVEFYVIHSKKSRMRLSSLKEMHKANIGLIMAYIAFLHQN